MNLRFAGFKLYYGGASFYMYTRKRFTVGCF